MNRLAPLLKFLYRSQVTELDSISRQKCYRAQETIRVYGSDISDIQLIEIVSELQNSISDNRLDKIKELIGPTDFINEDLDS